MRFKRLPVLFAAFVFSGVAHAAVYTIDLGLVADFEEIRPLVDLCLDLGELEKFRATLESATDLERLRPLLEDVGFAEVRGCPSDVKAIGG